MTHQMRSTHEQVSDFLKYAIALTRVHLQLARLVNPVQGANKCGIRPH